MSVSRQISRDTVFEATFEELSQKAPHIPRSQRRQIAREFARKNWKEMQAQADQVKGSWQIQQETSA